MAADNENGQLTGAQESAHVLAHGILAAAVASAGGNDATTAGLAAAGSEAAAPVLKEWLYGNTDPNDLNEDQQDTIVAILSAASATASVATGGDASDSVAAGQLAENAVENNFLCGGACVGAGLIGILAYLTSEGEGSPAEGAMKIGRGEDTISETLDDINEVVDAAAYEVAPELTQAVADVKADIGSFTNEMVTYVDEKTGKTVSGACNELDPKTQEFLKGSGIILSVVVPAARTASLTTPDVDLSLNKHSGDGTGLSGNNGSFEAESDFGHLNQKTPQVIVGTQPNQINLSNEIVIYSNPEKTTTILGKYDYQGSGTRETLELLDYPKTYDIGEKKGGFNLLNIPTIPATVTYKGDRFWDVYNKPLLDEAIKRGDDFAITTKPTPSTKTDFVDDFGRPIGMYGQELKFLIEKNVKPVNISNKDWEVVKGWFQEK